MVVNPHVYTPIYGVMQLLTYQNNYPDPATGSQILSAQARNLLGPKIPQILVEYSAYSQYNLFGDYAMPSDKGPSILFTVLYSIIAAMYIALFGVNFSRGHYFWPGLGFIFYSICRVVGFGLRIQWTYDITQTAVGISSEVFLILPQVLLTSFNLILAQRIFTWRHPVGGSRKLFWTFMLGLYAIVAGVIAMTIVAAAGLQIFLLGHPNYQRYVKVIQASSILIILYSLTSISLLGLAFFFKPTRKDENLYTYQPWWIKSFSPFYFVKKGEPQEAGASFLKRNHNHRYAIRVIAATHHHYKTVKGLSNERGDLAHNVSMMILAVTTLIIFLSSVLRSVVCFQARIKYDRSAVGSPAMMYVFWGALEIIVNLIYLIGRVDLRFYRPDRLPKSVREIVTAEQSLNPSEIESDDEANSYGEQKLDSNDESSIGHNGSDDDMDDFNFGSTKRNSFEYEEDDDSEGFDFTGNHKATHRDHKHKTPYPYNEKSDVESEFHF
ncbi:hypothetical protein CANMA_000636 [Candida margitis]|uniref:uncharacterized protein n=1 Tax=Candida margitis TaxID=1775924 RepID=UPI00222672BF|nr:uncharacterized protein CANMA_000636 [Candida margitis]KAI5970284.1 hypothetical protein CANMA_000636 [Candida margitis]